MTEDGAGGSSPLIWMGLGFGLALAILVAAFFQDIVLAIVRRILALAERALAPAVGAAAGLTARMRSGGPLSSRPAGGRALGRAGPGGVVGRPRPRRQSRAGRPGGDDAERPGSVDAERPGDDAAARPAVESLLARAPARPEPPREEPDEPASAEVPAQTAADSEPATRRRLYRPASSIHVEASVRDFLASRGGSASVDALVRYLDREFGTGLGVGMLESLRKRSVIEMRREPPSSMNMTVRLAPGAEAPSPPPGAEEASRPDV